MSWLFFAVFSQAVYTIVVFIDKYILEKQVADYRGMPIYSAIIGTVFGFMIWVATGFPILSLRDSALIMFTGMLTVWGLASYFKALASDEASKVTFLFQMQPVITLLLAFMFLNEKISSTQLSGFLLILISAIGVSVEKKLNKIKFTKTLLLILLTDFLWALTYVIFKFVVDSNSFSKVISYESWGIGLGGMMLYIFSPAIRKAFHKTNSKVGSKIIWFIAINEAVFLIARFLKYLAVTLGPVALVDVAGGTQIIFAIFYGFILTLLMPKIFKENITKGGLSKKIIFGTIILWGLWLIKG